MQTYSNGNRPIYFVSTTASAADSTEATIVVYDESPFVEVSIDELESAKANAEEQDVDTRVFAGQPPPVESHRGSNVKGKPQQLPSTYG